MSVLPEDILYKIWKIYYNDNVCRHLEYKNTITGFGNVSPQLKKLLENDRGAYQEGYSGIEEMMEDHKLLEYQKDGMCINCRTNLNFPCNDCNNKYFDGLMKVKLTL